MQLETPDLYIKRLRFWVQEWGMVETRALLTECSSGVSGLRVGRAPFLSEVLFVEYRAAEQEKKMFPLSPSERAVHLNKSHDNRGKRGGWVEGGWRTLST